MELQQLRYMVAVAELRNFTRAAERCLVVQSALSHQIKALEREIGMPLFARTSRRVELTEAGAAFLPAAREAIAAAARAVSDAAAATGEVRGRLSIGVIPTLTGLDLPTVLGVFHRRYPLVQLSLRSGGSDAFMADLRRGELDFAVLGLPDGTAPEGVACEVLARESLVAVVHAGHRLAGRKRIRLADVAERPQVDFPAGTPGRNTSDRAFRRAEVSRQVAFEVMEVPLILDLVRQGLAMALLPPAVVPADSGLVTLPVGDGPRRTTYLAWSALRPSAATLAFLETVRAVTGGN